MFIPSSSSAKPRTEAHARMATISRENCSPTKTDANIQMEKYVPCTQEPNSMLLSSGERSSPAPHPDIVHKLFVCTLETFPLQKSLTKDSSIEKRGFKSAGYQNKGRNHPLSINTLTHNFMRKLEPLKKRTPSQIACNYCNQP